MTARTRVSTERRPTPWSDLPGALRCRGSVDQVELKIQLDQVEMTAEAAAAALGLRVYRRRAHRVYYLDTPDHVLGRHGLITRARLGGARGADLTVKLRLPGGGRVPRPVRRSHRLAVELDALPDRTLWCASVSRPVSRRALRATLRGERSWARLCSADQRAFLVALVGGRTRLPALAASGPVAVQKLVGRAGHVPRLAVERWCYPDGTCLLELSTTCAPDRARRVAARVRELLDSTPLAASATQVTKTERALR